MAYYWLVIACSWFGSVSLQYINTGGPAAEGLLDPLDSTIHYAPIPYVNYLNLPLQNEFDYPNETPNIDLNNQFYQSNDNQLVDLKRNRRTVNDGQNDETRERRWQPNLIDLDKTTYLGNDEKYENPFVIQNFSNNMEENGTDFNLVNELEKRNFSPWGGKRDKGNIENMWTWKRALNIREPSMPKRVRFSPWGGKRGGQMIYKPGSKGSKLIFSTSVPELTRIVTNYSPTSERFDFRGFQFVPTLDKRHPIKILALSTKVDERTLREALPYKTFMENIPKLFKPGHTYSDVALKTDGKRKVKFSAWGGKRSPPIIGPIWTPAPQNLKESTLNAILLIRNNPDAEHLITKQL
ncbi:unnamed protein product [Parnassius apollo]|uniref:(apollo) hypothetical protein n=1 Tax=Parnassius apollo TaxID=110799 RepID=A0A8S3WDL7_PARAO|nr:unnamed protein product [Parnassius apollo]